jgi:alpha-L-fucosidase
LNATVRELQPGILINNRSGRWSGGESELPEDFGTPEQDMASPTTGIWENCMTMNNHWGYVPTDTRWKSSAELIAHLVRCASANGNYLLNVGPDPDGSFPPEAVARLRDMGRWLRSNGESIYRTRIPASLQTELGWGVGMFLSYVTVRDTTLYLHVLDWPGQELVIGNLQSRVLDARFLDGGEQVRFRQDGTHLTLSGMPQYAPDPLDTVIALSCNETPRAARRFA